MPAPLSPPRKARAGGGLPSPAGSELPSPCWVPSFLLWSVPAQPTVFPSGCSKSLSVRDLLPLFKGQRKRESHSPSSLLPALG